MKYWIVGTLAMVIGGGSSATTLTDDDRHGKARVFQTAPIQGNQSRAEGAAWLKRTKNSIEGRVMFKVDYANTPHSIWWVIFHYPEFCMDRRGADDLGNPAVHAAIFEPVADECGKDVATRNVQFAICQLFRLVSQLINHPQSIVSIC